MRPVILCGLYALAVVAIPIAIEINSENEKHLEKRGGTDAVIADAVKALIAFGAFVWGGSIIAKYGVNYYFEKKAQIDVEKQKKERQMMAAATMRTSRLTPNERKKEEEKKKEEGNQEEKKSEG
jgi:ribulose-5-phosphate 4-epimerase/fuculose-1-phosphate aldolase